MIPNIPDQSIPTLMDVVPLEGAKSISTELLADQLLFKEADVLARSKPTTGEGELADKVMQIVRARLVEVLPGLMREALAQVLDQEIEIRLRQNPWETVVELFF